MVQAQHKHLICCTVAILCAAWQICMGATGPVQTGVGIFDTVFIAANTSLGIKGDIYLTHAHILGKGSLEIQGESQNKIVSNQSEVSNLEVITHGKISLEGELAVKQTLTIQYGTFDISSGLLAIFDSTKMNLRKGATLHLEVKVAALPLQSAPPNSVDFLGKSILVSLSTVDKMFGSKIRVDYPEVTLCAWDVYQDVAFAPPEGAVVSIHSF